MNNKGFAITTILYGILVLFCLLLVSLLGVLSSYRKTKEKLINENNGARSILGVNTINNDVSDDTYTLTLNCNGGSLFGGAIVSESFELTAGTIFDLGEYGCGRNGYYFTRWNTRSDGNGTTYDKYDNYEMPNNDVTLYAMWISNN